ncbi:MAG: hypothetical protein ABL962_01275 [Fimbriimonadaceae bacterium]
MTRSQIEREVIRILDHTPWWVFVMVIPLIVIVSLWSNWRLFKRMGYSGFWSLFVWFPGVSTLLWMGLAFSKWPNEKR